MSNTANVVLVPIVLNGLPDTQCFADFKSFLAALPNFLVAEVPTSITNVIVSNSQPTDSQTTDVWFRLSNDGSFLGIYVFSQGAWQQIYPVNVYGTSIPDTSQVFWFVGDSTQPPPGWTNTNDYTGFDAGTQAALAAMWYNNGTINVYYSAVFTGF